MAINIFWIILSIGFLVLAFLSYLASKKPLKDLKDFSDHKSGTWLVDSETREKRVKFETSLYELLKGMAWVNFVAFLLAALAAILSL